MEPGGPFPHLQKPTTCPCPEPDQSNPYPPSHFLMIGFNIILPYTYHRSSKWSLSLRLHHQNPVRTLTCPHTWPMTHPSSFLLIWSPEYLVLISKPSRYGDLQRAGRSGDRIPVGSRYSTPIQTGPGAHPASYSMGTRYLPGVKRPGRGIDHPPQSSAEVKERVELYLFSLSGPSWPVIGWTLRLP